MLMDVIWDFRRMQSMTKLWTGITLWKTRLKYNLCVVILDEIMCKIECEHKNINALMSI
jgi:hypothetical protein